ncbi:TonB-dependent receptor [Novosphingobium profundi]|uniref:TonB-dependent receptor plug domain-containing protein n=1 Tax=Novosphingobium profundi TaxID=1774954 RepID=UPI001BDA48F3|nr:TonB-dependent receptor [Novosphingobium profundi]MBT0670961.1 TonB-dependent receptor [Novosphingobium profundi]
MRKHLLTCSVLALGIVQAQTALAQSGDAAASDASDGGAAIVVTGSRGQPRTVTTSPTPIDVISGEQIAQMGGSMQLRDVLTQLVPSFQSQQVGSSSWNSVMRPAGLRGLSGVHVLVLVNGKRRHNSAMIDLASGSTSMGGNPVDLDMIPTSAIERIEVLRDGAAAQYGSDAIAGVINVILKGSADSGSASIEAGQRYKDSVNGSDGETVSAQVSKGFHIGDNGSIVLSAEGKLQKKTVRNSDATARVYSQIDGEDDPREATANRRTYQGGLPQIRGFNLAQNSSYDTGDLTLYSNATFGYRETRVGQSGRRPSTTSDIIAIYPDGFTPYYTSQETDFQATAGMKSQVSGWDLDLSTTYGRDYVRSGADNTLNASLGEDSPTSFDTFSSAFDQWTTNLDLTKGYEVLGGRHLQVSAGAEFRYESYVTKSLDRLAWYNGGYQYGDDSALAGQYGAIGAQGAIIVTPEDEADEKRTVGAAYLDLALDVTDRLLVSGAGRFETYDDSSGSVWSGKVSAIWKATDWLNFRGAFSNGFRAPSLSQQGYAQTATQVSLVNGSYQLIQSKILKTGSAIAQALGAQDLKPEKSRNYSLGVTMTPLANFSLTVDAYQIEIDDRITMTGLLSGTGISTLLEDNGYSGDQYVRFFANAIDTRTRGIDVVSAYSFTLGEIGRFRASAAYNYNKTKITHIADDPAPLADLGLTLFDRQTQGYFTVFTPRDKVILGLDWNNGPFSLRAKETRYGSWKLLANNSASDQSYGAKWITDLEAGYAITPSMRVAIGAYNLFNTYPDKNTVTSTIGSSPYGSNSPFGAYGGYYYARLSFDL